MNVSVASRPTNGVEHWDLTFKSNMLGAGKLENNSKFTVFLYALILKNKLSYTTTGMSQIEMMFLTHISRYRSRDVINIVTHRNIRGGVCEVI